MAIDPLQITKLDSLLHQQSRLLIMTMLFPVESADFLYLLQETALTKGNLSTHLAKLEKADYLSVEKTYRGKTPLTIYALTTSGRDAFATYRRQLREIADALPE
ncbi:MAG: transcriptional regulator [Chloroflexota bacterium]